MKGRTHGGAACSSDESGGWERVGLTGRSTPLCWWRSSRPPLRGGTLRWKCMILSGVYRGVSGAVLAETVVVGPSLRPIDLSC